MGDKNCNVLKTMANNFNKFLNKMDQARGLDFSIVNENQGLSKHTRAYSKKTEGVEANNLDDMKDYVENMNILANQVVDLLKTL